MERGNGRDSAKRVKKERKKKLYALLKKEFHEALNEIENLEKDN